MLNPGFWISLFGEAILTPSNWGTLPGLAIAFVRWLFGAPISDVFV